MVVGACREVGGTQQVCVCGTMPVTCRHNVFGWRRWLLLPGNRLQVFVRPRGSPHSGRGVLGWLVCVCVCWLFRSVLSLPTHRRSVLGVCPTATMRQLREAAHMQAHRRGCVTHTCAHMRTRRRGRVQSCAYVMFFEGALAGCSVLFVVLLLLCHIMFCIAFFVLSVVYIVVSSVLQLSTCKEPPHNL